MTDTRFESEKWDLWGHWDNCVLFTSIFSNWSESRIFKELNLKDKGLKGDIKILSGDYHLLLNDRNLLRELVVNSLESDKKYIDKLLSIYDKHTKEFLKLENGKDLRKFILALADFAGCVVTDENTSAVVDIYFKEIVEKSGMSYDEFLQIVKPSRKSLLMIYFDKLREVTEDNIDEFVKEFEWVGTRGSEGEPLTKAKALKEKKELKEQTEKTDKKIPKELEPVNWLASELMFQRANIIETTFRVTYSYRKRLKELGEKYGLSYEEIISLTWYELIELIDKGILPDGFKQRTREFGIMHLDGKTIFLIGKDLEKELYVHQVNLEENIDQVEGAVAFKGKVKGIVRIIMNSADVSKVKKGDILVAPETTADFVPAMAKASAFVTNQGGITSHAAIISREMKKPCVIGTRIGTKVFKDGDMIEVDANKGIVRRLK